MNYISDSQIFNPPVYKPTTPENMQKLAGIGYRVFTRKPPLEEKPTTVLRILHSHGVAGDVNEATRSIDVLLNTLEDQMYMHNVNAKIILLAWDYPGYGLSDVGPRTEKDIHWKAELMWIKLLEYEKDCVDFYNISIGFSFGTSAACYIASKAIHNCSIALLQAPFSGLVKGSGSWAYSLLGELYDNVKLFETAGYKKGINDTKIIAMYISSDRLLPMKYNQPPLEKYVDYSIVIDSSDHEYFLTPAGAIESAIRLLVAFWDLYEADHPIEVEESPETNWLEIINGKKKEKERVDEQDEEELLKDVEGDENAHIDLVDFMQDVD